VTPGELAAALERARLAACPPLGRGCLAFPIPAAEAEHDAEGWMRIGWIHDSGMLTDWYAWYDPTTGEGRLRRWKK
jgi:hypothetical protein